MTCDDLALVVVSCDTYTDLGTIFFDLQSQYMGWFDNPRYFVNESKDVDFNDVRVIHVGNDCNWSEKVKRALQLIPEKYLLFMLEDYFIGSPVMKEHICEAVQTIKKHNLCYYRITKIPMVHKKSKIADYLAPIPRNMRYGINLQAAIFDRQFLLEIIDGPDRTAWEVETDLLLKVNEKDTTNFEGCVLDKRNIIDVHNAVIKGMWFPDTIRFFRNKGYHFSLGDRPTLSQSAIIKMKVIKTLSHILPTCAIRRLKRLLKKCNVNFLSQD